MPLPRLRQSCRPRGRDRLRSPSCALATAGATDRRPPARDAVVANARSGRESPTVQLAVPGLPLVLKARPPGARTSRGMLGLVAHDPRLSGTSGGCRLRPLSSRGMSGVDRVRERRRAAALARHYRDLEDLSIKEIARRLGRAEATVKAYLYDPSDANKGPSWEREAEPGGRELRSHPPAAASRGDVLPRRTFFCARLAVQHRR